MYEDFFIDSGEASSVLGLSSTSLQKLVDSGKIPSVKTADGHRRLIRSTVVALSQQTVPRALLHLVDMSANEAVPQVCDKLESLTVVVVEDDTETTTRIASMFAQCFPSVNLLLPTNALDTLLILERNRPHILIADQSMKSFDGYMLQLLQMVTQRPEYQSVVVVVVLDMSKPEIELGEGLLPSILFLYKPFDLQRLRGFVDAHVHMLCLQRSTRPEATQGLIGLQGLPT